MSALWGIHTTTNPSKPQISIRYRTADCCFSMNEGFSQVHSHLLIWPQLWRGVSTVLLPGRAAVWIGGLDLATTPLPKNEEAPQP